MKAKEIFSQEFSTKVAAIAAALGGTFRRHEFNETAGIISGAAPFDIHVTAGYRDGRLHFSALLSRTLPDGSPLWVKDYTHDPINNECSSDFSRPIESIAKQVARLVQSVMPHWDRLTKIYDERLELMSRTDKTMAEIKSLLGDLVIENRSNKNAFYVRGISGNVSTFGENVYISGLNTLSLSPARAEKLIRLLIEEDN